MRFFLAPLHILIENSAEEFARNGSRVGPHMMFSARLQGPEKRWAKYNCTVAKYEVCCCTVVALSQLCHVCLCVTYRQTDRQTEPEQEGEIKK